MKFLHYSFPDLHPKPKPWFLIMGVDLPYPYFFTDIYSTKPNNPPGSIKPNPHYTSQLTCIVSSAVIIVHNKAWHNSYIDYSNLPIIEWVLNQPKVVSDYGPGLGQTPSPTTYLPISTVVWLAQHPPGQWQVPTNVTVVCRTEEWSPEWAQRPHSAPTWWNYGYLFLTVQYCATSIWRWYPALGPLYWVPWPPQLS